MDQETRTVGPINEGIGSLAIVQKILSDGYRACNADWTPEEMDDSMFNPLFVRVMSDHFTTFARLLKDDTSEARLERWLNTLKMTDVAAFQRIRNVLTKKDDESSYNMVLQTTYQELDREVFSEPNEDVEDEFPFSEFMNLIMDCVDSFIEFLHEPSAVHLEELVYPRFVGPFARHLLTILADENDTTLMRLISSQDVR